MSGAGPRSRRAFARACRSLAGGVDSPVRAFGAVGGSPLFFSRGRGPYLWDLDGRRYLDLLGSWGANLLGNAPAPVVRAVRAAAGRGLTFGAPSTLEHELAERIHAAAPELGRIRFVSSGTEAVMSAVRLARGVTGRSKVVMFEGGYHGHSDGLLARAGSGVGAAAAPGSAGVPASVVSETLLGRYNDTDSVRRLFELHGEGIAAVLVEPVAGNMGVVPPRSGFLPALGRICRQNGAFLIADEVITGFRLRRGLYHPRLGVRADLVTLGKVIGGGLPVAAYGGAAEVMEAVAPSGPVYQAGTLAGNPVAMAAGAAALDALTVRRYRELERISGAIARAWGMAAEAHAVADFHLTRVGSMLGVHFGSAAPREFESAKSTDRARYARFFWGMLEAGAYLPPSPLETTFVSMAMADRQVEQAASAASRAMARLGAPR